MTVYCGDRILADKIALADNFYKRFKGLMGIKRLEAGEGLLLNCVSIHCFFMKIPIDAVYISKEMTVLGKETLKPWSIGKWFSGTKYILELQAGTSVSISAGAKITIYNTPINRE